MNLQTAFYTLLLKGADDSSSIGSAFGDKSFSQMINGVINLLMVIVVVAAVIFIMVAGIQYISSHGDAQKAKTAMASITNAIIGLVVAFAAYILVSLVLKNLIGSDSVDDIINENTQIEAE